MAGTVGGVYCFRVGGEANHPRQRIKRWQVPGLNGYGAQKLGLGDSAFEFRLVQFSTEAGLNTWFAAIESMQGSVITIINDHATTTYSCLLESVSGLQKRAAWMAAGLGSAGRRGEVTIRGVVV